MPRYDDSPRGPSPYDRRDRHMKSPLLDRRPMRRDSPPLLSRMSSRDHMLPYHHEDYPPPRAHHSRNPDVGFKILCVSNISNKYPDSTVRNELIREFSRFGEIFVKLVYDKTTRLAYIYFNNYDEAREARHFFSRHRLILLNKEAQIDPIYDRPSKRSTSPEYGRGSMRNVSPVMRRPQLSSMSRSSMNDRYQLSHSSRDYRDGYSNHHLSSRDPYYSSSLSLRTPSSSSHQSSLHQSQSQQQTSQQQQQRESKKEKFPNYLHHIPPEDDEKATRTLFVGNLEVTITEPDLRRIFERYGEVDDIDVKRPMPGQGNAYAFIKFLNLDMAHRAKVEMSGQHIGKFQCKIGYGKATPSTRIWVGGLGPWTNVAQLDKEFDRFGAIRKIDYAQGGSHAYIQYDTVDAAQAACAAMRGYPLGGSDKRLRIDYADPGNFGDSTSPKPASDSNNFNYTGSPRAGSVGNNNNGSNYDFWGGRSDQPPSPKRRRQMSADKELEHKRSPHYDSFASPSENNNNNNNRDSLEGLNSDANFELSNGKSVDMKVTINNDVTSFSELTKCCPPLWTGGLILKSSGFATRAVFCAGDSKLVELMRETNNTEQQSFLRITQRLRLEQSKLDDVLSRVYAHGSSGYLIMICTQANNLLLNFANLSSSASNNGEESTNNASLQQRLIKNLVNYLKSKEAAGVIILNGKTTPSAASPSTNTNSDQQPAENDPASATTTTTTTTTPSTSSMKSVLYLFPPHSSSIELISRKIAPNINAENALKEDFLVGVLVRSA